jgi:hypothetical protein
MPDPVNFIGNDDIRKVLEVALVLIGRAKTDTSNSRIIKDLVEQLNRAISLLEGTPGSPPSVVT